MKQFLVDEQLLGSVINILLDLPAKVSFRVLDKLLNLKAVEEPPEPNPVAHIHHTKLDAKS